MSVAKALLGVKNKAPLRDNLGECRCLMEFVESVHVVGIGGGCGSVSGSRWRRQIENGTAPMRCPELNLVGSRAGLELPIKQMTAA
jgi:hypothetical protein